MTAQENSRKRKERLLNTLPEDTDPWLYANVANAIFAHSQKDVDSERPTSATHRPCMAKMAEVAKTASKGLSGVSMVGLQAKRH